MFLCEYANRLGISAMWFELEPCLVPPRVAGIAARPSRFSKRGAPAGAAGEMNSGA